ncbi:MAG: hypothetical protein ACI97P_000369 [Arcticibacterium sp.]
MSIKSLVFGLLFLLSYSLYAQVTLELGAERDNSIYSESLSKSNGVGPSIFAGRIARGATFRRGLVKFDVSSLPANAIIQSAELNLSVFMSARSTTTKHRFDIHRLNKDWGEANSSGSGSGDAAQTNDATWGSNFFNVSNWTNLGSDFEASISATDSVFFTEAGHTATWTSGAMVADVNFWKSNPSSNFGWVLIGDESVDSSAKAFFSKEAATFFEPFKPKLNITYTIPSDHKITINELNPNKKWVELYNPDSVTIDLSEYTVVNGMDTSTLSGGNVSVLNGSLMLDSSAYVVLKWPNIGQNVGELALYNADTTSGDLIDYIQYGSGNQTHAAKAVTAAVWDNVASFKPSISDSAKSFSLTIGQPFINGEASNATHWLTQLQTPTYINNPCLGSLSLKGNLVEADYYASDSIQVTGILSSPKEILIDAGKAVNLNPGLLIESGNVFGVEISGCPE